MALVDELPHRPWARRGHIVDGRFRWRLGVRPLDLDDWFEWGADGHAWVAEKPAIIRRHGRRVFDVIPGVDREATEAAHAVAEHVGVELDPSLHPLDAAARLVPDDLVLMAERDGRLVFAGGSVCFPNRWDFPSKLGLTMAETHGPVAELNNQLEAAVDGFFDRLTPEQSYWRLGWGLIDSPDGFEPPEPATPQIEIGAPSGRRKDHTVRVDDERVHVRVERESLRRLPETGCVLFGIRTYITPFTVLDASDRDQIRRTIEAMSDEVRAYKDVVASPLVGGPHMFERVASTEVPFSSG